MRALVNVNVLIALLDADHSLHARATAWFAGHARGGLTIKGAKQRALVTEIFHPSGASLSFVLAKLGGGGRNCIPLRRSRFTALADDPHWKLLLNSCLFFYREGGEY